MNGQFNVPTKAIVTVSEMARMVGLSRARFYQLIGSAFPEPSRDGETGRPFYTEEQQRTCLDVRRRNCGIDGKPILFYARRGGAPSSNGKRRKPKTQPKPNKQLAPIVEAVKALGLASVSSDQVVEAVTNLFPEGIESADRSEVIRTVFVHLQRQNSSDNLGR
jgi:hypothetical protein